MYPYNQELKDYWDHARNGTPLYCYNTMPECLKQTLRVYVESRTHKKSGYDGNMIDHKHAFRMQTEHYVTHQALAGFLAKEYPHLFQGMCADHNLSDNGYGWKWFKCRISLAHPTAKTIAERFPDGYAYNVYCRTGSQAWVSYEAYLQAQQYKEELKLRRLHNRLNYQSEAKQRAHLERSLKRV